VAADPSPRTPELHPTPAGIGPAARPSRARVIVTKMANAAENSHESVRLAMRLRAGWLLAKTA
jgi:hypothetical protein